MKKQWINTCLSLARQEADFYSGARKIIRSKIITFDKPRLWKDDLLIQDSGFTKSKMTMLRKNYYHQESHVAALELWKKRREQDKYGSVGFTTYNHIIKGSGAKDYWDRVNEEKLGRKSRASIMGPCIQAVNLTLLPGKDAHTVIDVFYRTTEIFKKFPADLVFLEELLAPFDFKDAAIRKIDFHFANITCHPMYFVTLLPLLTNPIDELDRIRKMDKYFFDWVVKWTARYLCPEYFRGIEKFAQAMRVRQDALARLDKRTLKELQKYLKKNHPGYRNAYVKPEEDDAEDNG